MEMDEETRRLAEEVGTAINDSVQQSASVAAAIERLREAGFEMELTLKLEIGLRPQNEDDESDEGGGTTGELEGVLPRAAAEGAGVAAIGSGRPTWRSSLEVAIPFGLSRGGAGRSRHTTAASRARTSRGWR